MRLKRCRNVFMSFLIKKILKGQVTTQNRFPVFAALATIFLSLYFFNNYNQFFPVIDYQGLEWEKKIPFLPWTAWLYASDYVFPLAVGFLISSPFILTTVSWAFFYMSIIVNLLFFFLPIQCPREQYLIPEGEAWLLHWIRNVDSPFNSFPSAHVAIVWLTLLAVKQERPKYFPIFLVWALLICVSTLTTKQHFVIDVAGGILIGQLVYWGAYLQVRRSFSVRTASTSP